jgi:SAM-dependent methyltransferase
MTSKAFWNKEYKDPKHLTMSEEHAGDLETFEKWSIRNAEWYPFPAHGRVLDVGCGNGRNLIYLCGNHNMTGFGIDVSGVAIEQCKKMIEKIAHTKPEDVPQTNRVMKDEDYANQIDMNLAGIKIEADFSIQSAGDKMPLEDESVDVVLDMMTSHYLRSAERESYIKELVRVMKPYGWLFFKTFILDGDFHAKRLILENPDKGEVIHDEHGRIIGNVPIEKNSYIHPRIGVFEHVFTESEIYELFSPYFKIHKMIKSYKHIRDGKPYKRRTVSVYMEKKRID